MKLHHHVINHVKKHHKKYIFGVWIISWVTIAKITGLFIMYLWLTQSSTTDADYYELEYKATNQVISTNNKIETTDTGILK